MAYTEAMMDKEKEGGGKVLGSRVQVRVESRVRDVEHGRVDDTGVFNYTFWVEGKRVKVMPGEHHRTFT